MMDRLPPHEIDEVLDDWLSGGWTGGERQVYFQMSAAGGVELYANTPLELVLGYRATREFDVLALAPMLRDLVGTGVIDAIHVCGQEMLYETLKVVRSEQLVIPVRRVLFEGDCPTLAAIGSGKERQFCSRMLRERHGDQPCFAIVSVIGRTVYFGQANFRLFDDHAADLKTIRPLDEMVTIVIPELVARKRLKQILVVEKDVFQSLMSMPVFHSYRPLLTLVDWGDMDGGKARARCQAGLVAYENSRINAAAGQLKPANWLAIFLRKLSRRGID